MNKKTETITVNIDDKNYQVEEGKTILEAAQSNNIFIPSLCAYKNLTPHGGCRMCIVDVKGGKDFIKSCSTPVQDGMVVKTNTNELQKERNKILQLLLSEHTSSCLICDEKEDCKNSMGTIRKVGVTTGCRYCPSDQKCELQKVVEWVGVKELDYPVYYRNLPVEKEDPFYDRDYNLCILCGRCVRICHEVRGANTLAFNQRGRDTVIGPAFGRNHIEAGCEFCGACVEVCPTGALSEKSNKWDGLPEREEITTCSLCGVGCQMRVLVKNGKVMGTLPAKDENINNEQLCVKGRFCVNELVNNYQRLKKAAKITEGTTINIKMDEAITIAADKLSNCEPDEFGMIISPNCTTEDLYVAQKFVRTVMGSNNIDTTARLFYGSGFNDFINLMENSAAISDIKKSSVILCLGLDSRYGRSVIGVQLREASLNGSKIITIHPKDHNLALSAEEWIQPKPGEEAQTILDLIELYGKTGNGKSPENLKNAAELLQTADNPTILIGSEFIQHQASADILKSIEKLAKKIHARILTLPAQNNLFGSLLMGTYPEVLPGGILSTDEKHRAKIKNIWNFPLPETKSHWDLNKLISGKKLKVAYLVGEVPPLSVPVADYLIYQNIYPMDHQQMPDLTFPAATFTEVDGTFINGEGRIQAVKQAVKPPGDALPDWKILCKIANQMKAPGFSFKTASDIRAEIEKIIDNFGKKGGDVLSLPEGVKLKTAASKKTNNKKQIQNAQFDLKFSTSEHVYRGIPLTEKVEGFRQLIAGEAAIFTEADADSLGINPGDNLILSTDKFEHAFPVLISNNQKQGLIHIRQHNFQPFDTNPCHIRLERKNV